MLPAGAWPTSTVRRDSVLGRVVAIKMLAERYAADDDFRARFTREALTAASLSHPNVVTIFDVGEPDATPFIVMEYLGGGSLADRLREGRVPHDTAIAWLDQAAGALDAAHAAGIVHRDVKPGNLLLDDDGEVHVSDFGIARAAAHDPLTSAGTILGSSGYMAPEQARGEPATPASDRYALGCVAFELLTGRRPFEADSPTAEAMLHASESPPRASEVDPTLPAAVDTVLLRALAKNADARPRSATALVERPAGGAARGRHAHAPRSHTSARRADTSPAEQSSPRRSHRRPRGAGRCGHGGRPCVEQRGRRPAAYGRRHRNRAWNDAGADGHGRKPACREPPPPPPAEPSRSFASAAAANDQAYQMMVNEDFEGALPILEDAYGALAGSGTTAEAYTAYNLAFTRFALGSCQDVLALLDRSESIQGERKEISRLRRRAETSCDGNGGRGEGKGKGKSNGSGND